MKPRSGHISKCFIPLTVHDTDLPTITFSDLVKDTRSYFCPFVAAFNVLGNPRNRLVPVTDLTSHVFFPLLRSTKCNSCYTLPRKTSALKALRRWKA